MAEEKMYVGIKEKELPKGHFHWVAACNVDDCGLREAFASSFDKTYEEAKIYIENTNRLIASKTGEPLQAFYSLEIDVIPGG